MVLFSNVPILAFAQPNLFYLTRDCLCEISNIASSLLRQDISERANTLFTGHTTRVMNVIWKKFIEKLSTLLVQFILLNIFAILNHH